MRFKQTKQRFFPAFNRFRLRKRFSGFQVFLSRRPILQPILCSQAQSICGDEGHEIHDIEDGYTNEKEEKTVLERGLGGEARGVC